MADITKCTGTDCKIKESCYRYTAKSSPYSQSWFMGGIIIIESKHDCDDYWDNKLNDNKGEK